MKPDAVCTYCLDPADTEDHLMPVSRQTTRRRRGKMASVSERVPCCSMCNNLLGACPAFTVRDRAAVLILRYAERPRSEAHDTLRKLRNLYAIVAGFDLEPFVEEIDERQRRRFGEQFAAEQQRQADAEREIDEQVEADVQREMKIQKQQAERARSVKAEWDAQLSKYGYIKPLKL